MGKYTATDRYVLLETSREMPTLVGLNKNLNFFFFFPEFDYLEMPLRLVLENKHMLRFLKDRTELKAFLLFTKQ